MINRPRRSIATGKPGEQVASDERVRRESAASTSSETSSSAATGTTTVGGGATGTSGIQQQMEQTAAQIKGLIRRASQVASDDITNRPSGASGGSSVQGNTSGTASAGGTATGPGAAGAGGAEVTQSEEDTMKNLRKTFAGIFGDM